MADLPRDPFTIAEAILAAVVSAFGDVDVALPTRQGVIAGAVAVWDSDQLTVGVQSIAPGLIGQQQSQPVPWQVAVMTGSFVIQLVRTKTARLGNAPRGRLPSREQVNADGQTFMRDARILAGALHTAVKTNVLAAKGAAKFQGVSPAEGQGDMFGVNGVVEVTLA